jgi:hypothetical protein
LKPPSPSSAKSRAGGVMSAMRQLRHAWNVRQNAVRQVRGGILGYNIKKTES